MATQPPQTKDGGRLRELLAQRILVIDGAMGTQLQARNLTAADFGGAAYEGCNEYLNLTRPDVVREIHAAYLAAGADIVETNTFGGTPLVLAEYQLQEKAREINRAGARLAREAADASSTPDRPRFVAGSMGPTTKTLSVTGGTTFDHLIESFYVQALGLIEGGADLLLLETAQDTLNLKAAAIGIRRAQTELGAHVPLMISGTIEPMGTMLAGQGVEALYTSLEHVDIFSIGLNCATGPEFMTDHLRSLSALATCYVSVYPNAGLPDEEGHYAETPETLSTKLRRFVDEGWVNLIGGCCGTTPAHIAAIAAMVAGKAPRRPQTRRKLALSGIDYLPIEEDIRPVIVGERTNVIGSRKFKEMIVAEKFEEAAEIARHQVKSGAHVIDVCMANPDRNELADMERFIEIVVKKTKAPIVIDSTDAAVIETALKRCQGKCVINSINLEDGEERFEHVVPLLKKYGGAAVVGCIDEDPNQGMGVTVARKLAIAKRSYELLTGKYGLRAEDLIFDPLVFPVGTGDANYIGAGKETVEGVRAIKAALPNCRTILGISNVSFGLPAAGREVLNSVFLYHCVKAGLDFAIVNSEKLQRYPSIPEEERKLAEDLIFWRGTDPVGAFAAHFKDKAPVAMKTLADLPLDERLARYIVEGTKEGLIADLDLKLKEAKPLDIINGPLMKGMDEVGRLFNNNELIVAEVLLSAESMKTAVRHLEQFMEKTDSATRGKIILATVKGDVHDIGKNLVEIILGNNGYRIVNLGIKVPPEELINAYRRERPDAFGLSGLLVKSAQQMVLTAQDLKTAGIDIPILVGGAALTKKFTDTKIAAEYGGAVLYAKDAMQGLDLANQLSDVEQRERLIARIRREQQSHVQGGPAAAPAVRPVAVAQRSSVDQKTPLPKPPDYKPHQLNNVPIPTILPYINRVMLYGKHLGFKGGFDRALAAKDEKAVKLYEQVEALKAELQKRKSLSAQALYQFFPCQSEGDTLMIHDPEQPGTVIERFTFPRQPAGERLCLADYVRSVESNEIDSVALFVVSCGRGVRELAQYWKDKGEYVKSHTLQALAIEASEGLAEWLHQRIRTEWGIPDPSELTIPDLLKKKYRGLRVSFGYPACPDLADQRKLFKLLDATARIGVELTEGDMMDPEASVSALVFHHPEAKYFRADGGERLAN
jgi:5-methyltetrahydrofolate--homocysteine methyltransferase